MTTKFNLVVCIFIFVSILSCVENQKCIKLNHDSEEFRISAGAYEVEDSMEPDDCQALCKEGNYSYAAIMARKFCLCSDTNYDYPELEDERCCSNSPVDCGDDPDMVLGMQVEEHPDIELQLTTQLIDQGVGDLRKTVVKYMVSMKLNVEAELHLLYDNEAIKDADTFIGPEIEIAFQFTNAALPGHHVAKALAVDTATGMISSFDEQEFFIPDSEVSLDLECPNKVETDNMAFCNVTVYRGTDLEIEVQFADADPQIFEVSDAAVHPIGLPIPQVPPPSAISGLPSEVVHLSTGDLPFSILVGLEYQASTPGKFEVQILVPKCQEDSSFCGSCRSSCPERSMLTCEEGTEALCSLKKSCAAVKDPPSCTETSRDDTSKLEVVKSIEVTVEPPAGYIFHKLPKDDQVQLEPGFVIALKSITTPVVMFVGISDVEKDSGYEDTDAEGKTLGLRHLIRPVVVEPYNLSFSHNFTKSGKYKVKAVLTSIQDDEDIESIDPLIMKSIDPLIMRRKRQAPKTVLKDEKEVFIQVKTVLSGLQLQEPPSCVYMGEMAVLEATLEKGDAFTFKWMADTFEERGYTYEDSAPFSVTENYTCGSEGNFTVNIEATDGIYTENATVSFCCRNHISRNWKLHTDSPQIVPPGDITMRFEYTGNITYFPKEAFANIDFGDGNMEKDIVIADYSSAVLKDHTYTVDGILNLTVEVYNSFEFELFTTEVRLFEKLGNLKVVVNYALKEDKDLKDGHGPEKTDVPLNAIVHFNCNISGAVENYTMELENDKKSQAHPNTVFLHEFPTVGVYQATFLAMNLLEESNTETMTVRVMTETVGLRLEASPTSIAPHEEVSFNIEFESMDPFTCLVFDAADGDVLEAFGNEDTCEEMVKEEFKYNPRDSKRKRREAQDVMWIDDTHISLKYIYHSGGTFHPIAKAFNTIFQTNATAEVEVTFPPSNIWIENNSTNIRRPMRYFTEETFRIETTAQLFDHPSRTYFMSWKIDKIDKSDSVIESVDVTPIRSSNCSALRILERFLEVGLYKVQYFIDIYGNDTLEETATCFTYLEIMSSSLRPMIIKGGASYILRGYGQMVYLEAEKYSVDPDNPKEKGFKMEWTCKSFEPSEFLAGGEVYDDRVSLSSSSVTQHHTASAKSSSDCFKKPQKLKGNNLSFNTQDLINSKILYEIEVTVSKDSRKESAKIYLDVITDIPPGIIVMCDKPVACRVTNEGFIVNPSSFLSLRAECVTECGKGDIAYVWEIYGVDEDSRDEVILKDWKDFAIEDEDRFGVNKTFFESHQDYQSFHIHVTGIDGDRPKGSAKLYITVNKPPKPGICKLSPNTGVATVSLFSMEFSGWSDPEKKPLTDYSIYKVYKGTKFHIHYGVKTSTEFILPPGESQIFCEVQDELGATTTLFVDTVVATMPDNETLEEWKSSVNTGFFVVEGKMAILAQAVASEAFVDQIRREMDYVPISAEVNRIWGEYLEMEGIDSSFYTKEAREEIEAEVRDKRSGGKEESAQKNFEMLQSMEVLPFEVITDSEVYGVAVSALAESRPLNKGSKHILIELIEEMAESSLAIEVPHPEERTMANMLLANSMNSLSKSISEEMIGGNFLDSELEEVYDMLSYNITQPNFFSLYVEGSRWEVEERVHNKKVEGMKNETQAEVYSEVELMKNVSNRMKMSIAEDIMVGENPFIIDTTSGFQLEVEKRHANELSGETLQKEGTSVTLPNACTLLGQDEDCDPSASIGLV
ncbi:hypothetical protein JTE90_007255, partial [Oedothorax gibbosus]